MKPLPLVMIVALLLAEDGFSLAPLSEQQKNGKMKSPSALIVEQGEGKIFPKILDKLSSEPPRIVISLSKQRAYLMVGNQVAVESPISSGRRNGWTPKGEFTILEKDLNHYSSLYGDFVDGLGHIVRSGVSSRIDVAPSGTHFHGASMRFFMRLTQAGVGMHAGICPGYPASHGCIRLPRKMAEVIYEHVTVQTPVTVAE